MSAGSSENVVDGEARASTRPKMVSSTGWGTRTLSATGVSRMTPTTSTTVNISPLTRKPYWDRHGRRPSLVG